MNGFETDPAVSKPIEHLILDDSISEVMVNGPDRVFIEKQRLPRAGQGVSLGERSLMVAVKNIARRLGTTSPKRNPFSTPGLPDGSRVAAVIPPCSLSGVTLTIRKFNSHHFEIEDLIAAARSTSSCQPSGRLRAPRRRSSCYPAAPARVKRRSARLGKFIPEDERILAYRRHRGNPNGPQNLVRFEARREQNGPPAVTIRDLLKAALRHRPDRILVARFVAAKRSIFCNF